MDNRLKVDGYALRRLREDAWLTQAELAAAANVHELTIHKIEAGKVENPRRSTIKAIAKVLEVPPALLYHPEEEDEDGSALNRILKQRAHERELGIDSEEAPANGRYGAAWDFDLGQADGHGGVAPGIVRSG
jgi:transcriptional regulator with XRE-family HTH domain